MNGKIEKIVGLSIVAIGMAIAKNCAKTAEHVIPGLVKGIEHSAPRAAIITARQFLKNDNFQGAKNLDSWNENEYRDYFLTDLGKISKQVDTLNSIDSTKAGIVKRNYEWIFMHSVEKNNLDEIINKTKDSSNHELQAGAKYFCRLLIADLFIKKDTFKDKFMNDKIVSFFYKNKKKTTLKEQDKITRILSDHYYKNYFPFNKKLADKIIAELISQR